MSGDDINNHEDLAHQTTSDCYTSSEKANHGVKASIVVFIIIAHIMFLISKYLNYKENRLKFLNEKYKNILVQDFADADRKNKMKAAFKNEFIHLDRGQQSQVFESLLRVKEATHVYEDDIYGDLKNIKKTIGDSV